MKMHTKTLTFHNAEGEPYSIEVRAVWQICGRCEGDGHHSNPAIDGNGITQSEWAEMDEEFREGYLSGQYDIRCEVCGGSGKLLCVDDDAFAKEFPKEYAENEKELEYERLCDAESRWERKQMYGF
jgi:hypothetical protein